MKWTIEKAIPTLAVADLEAGIEFYSRLGFVVDWRWPEDSPTHAGLMLGSCSIMLSLCEPSERADVYFIVDDVSACHAAVLAGRPWELAAAARSLERPEAPKPTAYGLKDFSMVDPWGHHLSFGEVLRPDDSP